MRTKNVIRNVTISITSYILLFFISILVRKVFLAYFNVELLGYEGLFSSIFAILSMADMGSQNMFDYMLFEALAKKDKKELRTIMGMYQKLFRLIGSLVLCIGLVIYGCLPLIIHEEVKDWAFVKTIYLIQLTGVFITYFLAYRRALLTADQKGYQVTAVDTLYKTASGCFRVAAIAATRNYIVYLLVPLATSLLANLHISAIARKKYRGVFDYQARVQDFRERKVISQLRDLMVHKVSTAIYYSSDNFMIPMLTGLKTMGFYSNYQLLNGAIVQALNFFISAVGSSAGNLVYTESEEKRAEFFEILDFIGFVAGCVCMAEMAVCFQKVVAVLYGDAYLLSRWVPFTLGLDVYVACRGIGYVSIQATVGHYETSRRYSILSAILNIVLSMLFGSLYGLTGILAATVIGNVCIQAGRANVVFQWALPAIKNRVFKREAVYLAAALGSCTISGKLLADTGHGLLGLLLSAGATFFLTAGLLVALFIKTSRFQLTKQYAKEVWHVLFSGS